MTTFAVTGALVFGCFVLFAVGLHFFWGQTWKLCAIFLVASLLAGAAVAYVLEASPIIEAGITIAIALELSLWPVLGSPDVSARTRYLVAGAMTYLPAIVVVAAFLIGRDQ